MKDIIVSGMRPTGKLHIGHLSVIENWINLQKDFESYFFIADLHALTTKYDSVNSIKEDSLNMLIDWLSVGLDPKECNIFIQSEVPAHYELNLLLSMITPTSWLERCPTYKDMITQIRSTDIATHGFLGYPVLQTTDIVLYDGTMVPVGEDQQAHLEISREIVRRFNHIYECDLLNEPQAHLSETPFIIGTDGRKMSKSYNNQIDIIIEEETLFKKIKAMVTDPSRIRKTDPGHPDVCSVYSYHKLFNVGEVQNICGACTEGSRGCMDCKKELFECMNQKLAPFREKKLLLLDNRDEVMKILDKGREAAIAKSNLKLQSVKELMGLL